MTTFYSQSAMNKLHGLIEPFVKNPRMSCFLNDVGSGRGFCSEIGSFCLKNKSGIFVNGIIYDNETKERTFLFLMVLM